MIPDIDELRSSPLVHRFGDIFNPPGLTNFLGVVQADHDLTAFRSLNFPPLATSDTVTANLFLDGEYFLSTGRPITFTWYPDRLERTATIRDLEVKTTLVLAVGQRAALLRIDITATGSAERNVRVGLMLRGGVTQSRTGWAVLPPTEENNRVEYDARSGAVLHSARESDAHFIQGFYGTPVTYDGKLLEATVSVTPGSVSSLRFVAVIDAERGSGLALHRRLGANFDAEVTRAHDEWNAELRAAFTPGNDRYSGSLPVLHTSDEAIRRLYYLGALGLIYFKRDNPASVHGRAWDTLMPRYWGTVTFIWDYHLSSLTHALLDPAVMRGYLERWMRMDIHQHFGTDYLTGAGVGPWYAVNDYAMITMAYDYLRWSGDLEWLQARPTSDDQRVLDHLVGYATQWKHFETPNGLADYGGIGNLLECVATYIHEVASLNAANVYGMRIAADMAADEPDRAELLQAVAFKLVEDVKQLYADGEGFWHARYPDGRLVDVRHCYDFQTVLTTIPDDLSETQRKEMVEFFFRELHSPTWMRALSGFDVDASFSVRADHQWTGAYPAWPPRAAQALFRVGEGQRALEWLRGLARSANQGPFGQAHFVETAIEPDAGGARKAPPELPFITDWTCSSSGNWLNVVIESLFGVTPSLRNGITAKPDFGDFDPEARLTGLSYQGRLHTVTRNGIEPESEAPAGATEGELAVTAQR